VTHSGTSWIPGFEGLEAILVNLRQRRLMTLVVQLCFPMDRALADKHLVFAPQPFKVVKHVE